MKVDSKLVVAATRADEKRAAPSQKPEATATANKSNGRAKPTAGKAPAATATA